jgi:hypothetical protein
LRCSVGRYTLRYTLLCFFLLPVWFNDAAGRRHHEDETSSKSGLVPVRPQGEHGRRLQGEHVETPDEEPT